MECVETCWQNLMKHYGKSTPSEVQEHFKIDIRSIDAPYIGPELKSRLNSKGQLEMQHPYGYWYIHAWNGVEFNDITTHHPLDAINTLEGLKNYEWPNPDYFDYESIKRQCDANKDKAIQIGWPGAYQLVTFLRSAEKLYMDMALEPEFSQMIFDKFVDFEMEYYQRMFEAADGQIDIIRPCDDYGTQSSLLFSVEMWRDFFEKNTRRLVSLTHGYDAFYMQHSCGAIRPIIPELINCGVDILDPVQKVAGLEPVSLKNDFGSKLTFHGGIDTQNLLPFGKPDEVRKETKHFIDVLYRDGGYILAPSQSFEGDVPVENIEALYMSRDL
jgi:uroporphyrinogen decarboxylase